MAAFDAAAADSIRKQVTALRGAGAQAVVIDVRNNAEGDLANGLAAARVFVESGTLAIREMKGGKREPVEAAAMTAPGGKDTKTLAATAVVVLVDNGTAGAAELFASALAENHKGELIGEHTQGRAAAQKLVRLPDGSGLWLSSTRYLTAAAKPIHEQGLAPQVEVEEPVVEFGETPSGDDPILAKALERLKKAA
ncbi:MAG: S41 family peptidase [Acidobacteria bacterium]|nr:S41 family peptidase [Acidobacteriota bacterium]